MTSGGFPRLSHERTVESVFLLRTEDGEGYLRLEFDDLDLPPGSILQVGVVQSIGYARHSLGFT